MVRERVKLLLTALLAPSCSMRAIERKDRSHRADGSWLGNDRSAAAPATDQANQASG
jgi:hypothetical protein